MVNTGRHAPEDADPIQLQHITQIENPTNLKKLIEVGAIVSSTTVSYAVPSRVKGTWIDDNDAQQSREEEIPPTSFLNMALVNQPTTTRNKILSYVLFPESKGHANIKDLSYRTVYLVRVRPPVFSLEKQGDKLVDEKGYEYKAYTIYVIAESTKIEFQASSLLNLKGVVLPDPKTQRTTILVTEVQFPENIGEIDEAKLTALNLAYAGKSPHERLDWIVDNFEAYSRVIGRRNIAKAALLGFFTPTWTTLNGELQRGWANILILGDTTTAKTETVRKTIKLLQAGCIITAETASAVGLVGAATQLDKGGWTIDWGALVLNDRRLLAVDGAHKLGKYQFASLAEAERSGTVSIVKAAKDSAYARTRQIKIANPLDQESKRSESKNLGDFYYPIQAVPTFLDLMSIARLDLVVFADADDVTPEEINKKHEQKPDPSLFNLGEALKLVWGDRLTPEYSTEALIKIYEQATALYNEFFAKVIPVASIDLKWKLARLSAAAAALSLSTTDYKILKIEADHVTWVSNLIREEYQNAGLHTLAQRNKHETPDEEQIKAILAQVASATKLGGDDGAEKAEVILIWMAERGRFTKDQIKAQFDLVDNAQIRPLTACLLTQGLINSGSGFYATSKLNRLVRILIHLNDLNMVKIGPPQKSGKEGIKQDPQTTLEDANKLEDKQEKVKPVYPENGGVSHSDPDKVDEVDKPEEVAPEPFGDTLEEPSVRLRRLAEGFMQRQPNGNAPRVLFFNFMLEAGHGEEEVLSTLAGVNGWEFGLMFVHHPGGS